MDRMSILDMLGLARTKIDDGDGTEYMVPDNDRLLAIAKASAAMTPQMPATPSGAMRPPQVTSSPAPVMGAAPNPYMPVNYGIGSAPTMEQILKALQSRGYV